jgi:hypothetical protein
MDFPKFEKLCWVNLDSGPSRLLAPSAELRCTYDWERARRIQRLKIDPFRLLESKLEEEIWHTFDWLLFLWMIANVVIDSRGRSNRDVTANRQASRIVTRCLFLDTNAPFSRESCSKLFKI